MSTSRFTRFLKSFLTGVTVIPPAASFLESAAKGSTSSSSISPISPSVVNPSSTSSTSSISVPSNASLSVASSSFSSSQGGLLRKPIGVTTSIRNIPSSYLTEPPSPLSVAAAALASTAGGHANSLSSRNIVVSNVSYPANEPLEDRFDYKECYSGLTTTTSTSTPLELPFSPSIYSPTLLAAVLDGHGGWQVADYARRTLLSTVETELESCPHISSASNNSRSENENNTLDDDDKFVSASWHVGAALARAFARIDRSFLSAVRPAFEMGFGSVAHVGACALTAAVTRGSVVVANAGDCRAVLGRIHFGPTAPPSAIGAPVFFFSPLSLSGDNSNSSSITSSSLLSPFSNETSYESTINNNNTILQNLKQTILSDIGTVWHPANITSSSSSSSNESTSLSSSTLLPSSKSPSFFYSAVNLSRDHNAREPREKARLVAAHPGEDDVVVCKPGNISACYVKGRLQPTRSLGDGYLKDSEFNVPARIGRMWGRHIRAPYTPPYVTAHAELSSIPIQNGADSSSFLILACDGVWDELSSEEAVSVVADHVHSAGGPHRATQLDLEGAAEKLKEAVLQRAAEAEGMSVEQLRQMRPGKEGRRGYHDDITALVIFFGKDYTRPHISSSHLHNNNSHYRGSVEEMNSMPSTSEKEGKWWPF